MILRDIRGNAIRFDPTTLANGPFPAVVQESAPRNAKGLLVDCCKFDFKKDAIWEQATRDPQSKLIVRGILQRAGVKNQNGRVYPLEMLRREAAKYYEDFVKPRRALGELDHSESSVVALANASHIITAMEWQGENLMGTIEVLPTPKGNILRDLLLADVQIGISSRGLGSVGKSEDGGDVVNDDFELLSFDVVSNPSVTGAFLNESVNQNQGFQESLSASPIITPWDVVRLEDNFYHALLLPNVAAMERRFRKCRRWE